MGQKHFVNDKTKFAKPTRERYLGLVQIRNNHRITKTCSKSKSPE